MGAIGGFVGGWYSGKNPVSAVETLINWFPSAVETPGGSVPVELLPCPGLRTLASSGVGGGRGAWAGDGRCFVVFGNTLYELDASWTLTSRGTMAYDANPATISTNGDAGNQLLITSGGNAYVYDLVANTLTLVITGDCLQGGVVDGYGVVFGNGQIRISDLFDLSTWDPTQFAQRSIQPDLWQAMLVDPYGYINLIGSKTGESWTNQGLFPFPFAPERSGSLEEGIAAPFSLAQAGKRKVWLSTNANGGYQVMAARGFEAQRISHHALEAAIAGYGVVSDAFGQTYEHEGHAFYLLTFPTEDVTWCYDFTTGLWHQRASWTNGAFTAWRAAFHCFAFGKHLAVDAAGTAVYEITDAVSTDAGGGPMVRERQFYAGGLEQAPVFFDWLGIRCQTGVGLASGSAEDVAPQLMLAVSDDYGRTFGVERFAPVGERGDYGQMCQWWLLGQAVGRVYRLRASAAVPFRLSAAYQKVRPARALTVA